MCTTPLYLTAHADLNKFLILPLRVSPTLVKSCLSYQAIWYKRLEAARSEDGATYQVSTLPIDCAVRQPKMQPPQKSDF